MDCYLVVEYIDKFNDFGFEDRYINDVVGLYGDIYKARKVTRKKILQNGVKDLSYGILKTRMKVKKNKKHRKHVNNGNIFYYKVFDVKKCSDLVKIETDSHSLVKKGILYDISTEMNNFELSFICLYVLDQDGLTEEDREYLTGVLKFSKNDSQ